MSSKKLSASVVIVLSVALSLPMFAAPANGPRNRETKEARFTEEQDSLSPLARVIRTVKRGISSLSDGLTVPKP
ncbi:MAG: hypothetical protein ABI779_09185 [Acidobacteriota bacterium]